jgi:uncharacterized protein (DUF1697 family)
VLLRGINVGGKGTVKMSELKDALQNSGFEHVSTYINSGNVLFESDETNSEKLSIEIEHVLEKYFFAIKTVVVSVNELEEILKHVPENWEHDDLRKYIAFIKAPSTPDDVIKEFQPKEGIDTAVAGKRVVYMSTTMSGLTKSNYPKLITKNVYKNMTIRNYNTAQKLFTLMRA